MGRHSAPDEDAEESFDGPAVAVAEPRISPGRHARAEEDRFGPTAFEDTAKIARVPVGETVVEAVDETVVGVPAPPTPQPSADQPSAAQPQKPARDHATAADFALVREHADVRARVAAAVLVPFVVYTVAMAVLGKLDRSYLMWIWIPLITAGVLVGLFLDLGHRKYDR